MVINLSNQTRFDYKSDRHRHTKVTGSNINSKGLNVMDLKLKSRACGFKFRKAQLAPVASGDKRVVTHHQRKIQQPIDEVCLQFA